MNGARVFAGALAGVVFGIGLVLSGMTQPAKVIGFLDVTGAWDPSLMFVMLGAIGVFAPAYRFVIKRAARSSAGPIAVVTKRSLDAQLLIGAAIFGVGWGLGGFCPGPGVVAAGGGGMLAVSFALSMLAGMGLFALYRRHQQRRDQSA